MLMRVTSESKLSIFSSGALRAKAIFWILCINNFHEAQTAMPGAAYQEEPEEVATTGAGDKDINC